MALVVVREHGGWGDGRGSYGIENITYPEQRHVPQLQSKTGNKDSIEYKTINAINKVLGEPNRVIDLHKPLKDQFSIDSLDCAEISLELEDTFAIDFDSNSSNAVQPEMIVNFIISKIDHELKKKKKRNL